MCKSQADLETLGLFPAGQQQALFSGGQCVGDSPPLIPRGAPWLSGDAAPTAGAPLLQAGGCPPGCGRRLSRHSSSLVRLTRCGAHVQQELHTEAQTRSSSSGKDGDAHAQTVNNLTGL